MSKKLLWIITGIASFAVVFLIVVQASWIKNALMVKENQFKDQVYRTLMAIVQDVRYYENMFSMFNGGNLPIDSLYVGGLTDTTAKIYIDSTVPMAGSATVRFRENFSFTQRDGENEIKFHITITPDDTSYSIKRGNGGIQEKKAEAEKNRKEFFDNFFNRFFDNSDISQRIDPEALEKIIARQLNNRGINLDFEFAVVNNESEIVYSSQHFDKNHKLKNYTTQLFPDDIFVMPSYLTLYFPEEKSFLLQSLGVLATSTVILMLLVIFSFSATLFIIFRQKRLSEIKNDFIGNMTHELKTPISTISLASQMLSDKSIPTELKNLDNLSGIITKESKRLGYQVEKVLQMAIFDKGQIKLKLKEADFTDIVNSVIANFSLQIENKNGSLSINNNAQNTVVKVDTVHFSNVVSNLIDNAIKYSLERPVITISLANKKDRLLVSVADNGMGISKDDQKKIFEKFYRVPTGNVHNVKGFGLGLSYVKKIVEAHGFEISLKSEPGKGSTFTIEIPTNK
jgi:two-component system, OmpR family, phosphate regulon sensor histidine kinase PhoR